MIGFAAPTSAGFDKGLAAAKRGDFATALHEWRPLSSSPGADRDLATKNHDNVAKNLKPDQIAKAQRLAREWTVKFAAPKK